MKQIVVTVRAIIVHDGQLLMCRHQERQRAFFNLPGGKLEINESLTDGMTRELIEETTIAPKLSHLMFINQFINAENHRVEFFFYVKNGADYAHFDPASATHAYEIANFTFGDAADPAYNIQPTWLASRFADITQRPQDIRAEITTSS